MSKARDKANIPSLNFSSTGIDDNATSTAITINSSEQVAFTDGTVSLPSITNLGDENTGIFFPSADTIAFSEGGTEAMRITSDGRLGIGTTTPTEKLSVDGSVIFNESGNNVDFRVEGDTDANLLFVDASTDRVGIGNSSPSFKLDVKDGDVAIRETDSSVGSGIRLINDVGTQIIFRGAGSTRTNPGATQGMPQLVSSAGYDLFIGADGNNNIPFTTNRSERMRLTSDGKLGIGTSSPTEVLHVVGDILATGGDFKSDANNYLGFSNNTFARFVINDSEKMRIDSSGNVGIGTTSPSSLFHIYSSSPQMIIQDGGTHGTNSSPGLVFKDSSSSQGEIGFENSGEMFIRQLKNSDMTFRTNNTERMRIYSSGLVAINTTSPDAGSIVSVNHEGSTFYGLSLNSTTTSGTQYHLRFARGGAGAGYIASNSATTITLNNTSDERLKENIQNSNSAIQDLKDIQVRQFDWKDNIDTHRDFGFVAQELVNVVPEAVTQGTDELDDNGKPVRSWGVDYSHIVPRLVKVCQEQQTKIEELEARITALETNQP
jgi:hypothetical protein